MNYLSFTRVVTDLNWRHVQLEKKIYMKENNQDDFWLYLNRIDKIDFFLLKLNNCIKSSPKKKGARKVRNSYATEKIRKS